MPLSKGLTTWTLSYIPAQEELENLSFVKDI